MFDGVHDDVECGDDAGDVVFGWWVGELFVHVCVGFGDDWSGDAGVVVG